MSTNDKHQICILGAPGSGKTCFLAGLAFLAESTQDNTYQIKGETGTSTQRWLAELARTIRSGDWPPPTTGTKFYDFDLLYKKRLLSLGMIDYAGDSLVEALGELDQEQTAEIGEYLKSCKTLILLLDPQLDLIDYDSASHEEKNYSSDRVNALLTAVLDSALSDYLAEMDVAIIISKADTVEGQHNAAAARKMIEGALPGFYQKLKDISGGKRLGHFFISSVGETEPDDDGHFKPGTQLSPQGYDEIFDWIISSRSQKRLKKTIHTWSKRTFFLAALVFIVCASGLILYLRQTDVLNDPSMSFEQKSKSVNSLPVLRDKEKAELASQAEQELSSLEKAMAGAATEAQLQDILDKLSSLKGALDDSYQQRVQRLENELVGSMEKMLVDKIRRYMDESQWDEANLNIKEYYNKFPNGSLRDSVTTLRSTVFIELDKSARNQVRDITLARRPKDQWGSFLEDKAKAVEGYASKSGKTGPEFEDMLKAASLARYLAAHSAYKVKIKGAGPLKKSRNTYLIIQVDDKDVSPSINAVDSQNPSWNQERNTTWVPGNKVSIEWIRKDILFFKDDIIADINDDSIWALQKLSGSVPLRIHKDWVEDVVSSATVVFELSGAGNDPRKIEANDWVLLEQFIHPGEYWQK